MYIYMYIPNFLLHTIFVWFKMRPQGLHSRVIVVPPPPITRAKVPPPPITRAKVPPPQDFFVNEYYRNDTLMEVMSEAPPDFFHAMIQQVDGEYPLKLVQSSAGFAPSVDPPSVEQAKLFLTSELSIGEFSLSQLVRIFNQHPSVKRALSAVSDDTLTMLHFSRTAYSVRTIQEIKVRQDTSTTVTDFLAEGGELAFYHAFRENRKGEYPFYRLVKDLGGQNRKAWGDPSGPTFLEMHKFFTKAPAITMGQLQTVCNNSALLREAIDELPQQLFSAFNISRTVYDVQAGDNAAMKVSDVFKQSSVGFLRNLYPNHYGQSSTFNDLVRWYKVPVPEDYDYRFVDDFFHKTLAGESMQGLVNSINSIPSMKNFVNDIDTEDRNSLRLKLVPPQKVIRDIITFRKGNETFWDIDVWLRTYDPNSTALQVFENVLTTPINGIVPFNLIMGKLGKNFKNYYQLYDTYNPVTVQSFLDAVNTDETLKYVIATMPQEVRDVLGIIVPT